MKLLKIITATTLATALLLTTAFASFEPEIKMADDGLRMEISGTVDVTELGFEGAQVKKRAPFYPLQIAYVITDPETGEIVHSNQVAANKVGDFKANFILTSEYGDCDIIMYTAYGKLYEGSFEYTDGTIDEINEVCTKKDKDGLLNLIKAYKRYIGLDLTLFNKYTSDEQDVVLETIIDKAPYTKKSDLLSVYNDIVFNVGLGTEVLSDDEKTNMFNDYMQKLGPDYEDIAKFAYDNGLGSAIIKVYVDNGYDSVRDNVKVLALRAYLATHVKNVFDLDALFTDDNLFEIPSDILKKYKKVTKLQEFYTNLYEAKDKINCIEDLYDEIEKCIPDESKNKDDDKYDTKSGSSKTSRVSGPSSGYTPTPVTPVTPVVPQGDKFSDLASYEWAKTAIEALSNKGAINGDGNGNFLPGNSITREEFAKIAANAFGIRANGEAAKSFDDVKADDWFAQSINALVSAGKINGISDKEFGVGRPITRQDALVILARIANLNSEVDIAEAFTDDALIADYAKSGVYVLKNAGKVNGYEDGTFRPTASITRAEAAQMIYNILK